MHCDLPSPRTPGSLRAVDFLAEKPRVCPGRPAAQRKNGAVCTRRKGRDAEEASQGTAHTVSLERFSTEELGKPTSAHLPPIPIGSYRLHPEYARLDFTVERWRFSRRDYALPPAEEANRHRGSLNPLWCLFSRVLPGKLGVGCKGLFARFPRLRRLCISRSTVEDQQALEAAIKQRARRNRALSAGHLVSPRKNDPGDW